MEPQQIALLIEGAVESTLYALILFSVAAFVAGMFLLLSPQKVIRLRQLTDQWITPRKLLKPLEIPRDCDPFLYRNHQWVGAIAILLSTTTLYLLLYRVAEQLPSAPLPEVAPYLFWQWLYESALHFLWITNTIAFFVGGVIFFRPSLLRRVEGVSNQWLSTRQGLRRIDRSYGELDGFLLKRARWSGLFLVLGALYTLALILTFVLQHPDWLDLLVAHLYKE